MWALDDCCIDPLRPPDLSGVDGFKRLLDDPRVLSAFRRTPNPTVLTSTLGAAVFALVVSALLFWPSTIQEASGGSLAFWIVSRQKNYVVVGTESRNMDLRTGNRVDDSACKVISLGGRTLFFELGVSRGERSDGKIWSPQELAREVYRSSKQRDAENLSIAWGKAANNWFSGLFPKNLAFATDTQDGRLVLGAFVNFQDKFTGIEFDELFYDVTQDKLSHKQSAFTQTGFAGVGVGLMQEFAHPWSSQRAFDAQVSPSVGLDPYDDAKTIRAGIQFAIDNSTGPDHDKIHGPIDIAILRQGQKVEWVSRKDECYASDQPSTPNESSKAE
jgi:hypothetical protein